MSTLVAIPYHNLDNKYSLFLAYLKNENTPLVLVGLLLPNIGLTSLVANHKRPTNLFP